MSHINKTQRHQIFRDVLKGVSRSFYLTLRVLPAAVREPIGLAYLLARAADTLADTTVLPQAQRLHYLHCFKSYISNPDAAGGCDNIQTALRDDQANQDEARLLELLPQLFVLFASQSEQDKTLIRQVVTTLTDGMVFDLNTFPAEESGEVKALQREGDLEHYTYMVAGCVGEFWTAISMAHVNALAHWDKQKLVGQGIRFGKGLQLTNILRDLPRDLRIGRCYLPQAWLDEHGLCVEDLFDASNSAKARPLLLKGIVSAMQHFEAAEQYVLAIPPYCIRLRLAALWPMMIGLATLEKIAINASWLDVNSIIKVNRRWVYKMMLKSLLMVCSNNGVRSMLGTIRARAASAA